MELNASKIDLFIKALAVLGLASLLGLGIAGVVRLAGPSIPNPFNQLAGLFSFSRESLSLQASPATVTSGDAVMVSWTHQGRSFPGSYQFSYPCKNAITFTTASGDAIACGAAFKVPGVDSLVVRPANPGTASVNIALTVQFIRTDSNTAAVQSSTLIAVEPALSRTLASPPPPPPALEKNAKPILAPGSTTTTVKPVGSQTVVVPNGIPDLAISIASVGIIDYTTGAFTATSSMRSDQQAGVIFEVTNIGTAVSKPWDFSANLPIPSGLYRSDPQLPLAPGDKLRFTIGFKNVSHPGSNSVVFTVDPDNSLLDRNRDNDTATTSLFLAN